MKSKRLFFASFFILLGSICFASKLGDVEYECPICYEKFTYTVQYSYSIFGKNLDLKPFGAAVIPTPIPKCRKCGFVFDDEMFTAEEIQKLKPIILNKELKDFDKKYPNYYYLGQEMIVLEKPIEDIAWFFLESVWENTNKNSKEFLMENALKYLASIPKTSEVYETYLLIRIDLERRLGKFDKASKLIKELKGCDQFYKDYIVTIVEYQERLITEKDIDEHQLPEYTKGEIK